MLPAAQKQFEDQATNTLLLAALEEYEDSGTAQKKEEPNATMKPEYTDNKLHQLQVSGSELRLLARNMN